MTIQCALCSAMFAAAVPLVLGSQAPQRAIQATRVAAGEPAPTLDGKLNEPI